jgi:hypothetical protein
LQSVDADEDAEDEECDEEEFDKEEEVDDDINEVGWFFFWVGQRR